MGGDREARFIGDVACAERGRGRAYLGRRGPARDDGDDVLL